MSDECSVLLEVMMAKDPDSRQKSWSDVISDIDLVLKEEFPATPRPEIGQSQVMQMTVSQALSRRKINKKAPKAKLSSIDHAPDDAGEGEETAVSGKKSKMPLILGAAVLVIICLIGAVVFLAMGRAGGLEKKISTTQLPNPTAPKAVEEIKSGADTPPIRLTQARHSKDGIHRQSKEFTGEIRTPGDLHKALKFLNPDYNGKGAFNVEGGDIVHVRLYKCPSVSNISCLAKLPLREIYLHETKVSDISSLKNLKVEILHLSHYVSDISAVKDMPLTDFNTGGGYNDRSRSKDFTPLNNKTLKCLAIRQQRI